MPVTEAYMAPGQFRVSMAISTPHLMSTITRGGYLVITPQHMGDPRGFTNDNLLLAARYTGIVLETVWTDGVLTLEGAALEWILGDLDGIGWPCPTVNYSSSAITAVIALISGTGIIPAASFSIGSTITGAAYTGSHDSTETVKEVLAQVMVATGNHYKIEPNGEINTEVTTANNLYKSTPVVVFVRDNWGSDALWLGAPVDRLKSTDSIREWLDSSLIDMYGINDAVLERDDTTDTATTRDIYGAEYQMQEIRTSFAQIGDGASVGDTVYIFDPGSGFTGFTTIQYRGQYLRPAPHRIHEATWPVTDGMGVYYRPGGTSITSADWVDLTHTAAREPARTATTYLRALALNIGEGS